MGMMMVENIPFLHVIITTVTDEQGYSIEALSTIFMAFALSSILVGTLFWVLGRFRFGNAVHFFPKFVITGCIGGIGVFITTTGVEIATSVAWRWEISHFVRVAQWDILSLLLGSLAFEVLLRVLLKYIDWSTFPPFYFISIPIVFYVILFISGTPLGTAHSNGWFFDKTETKLSDFTLIWSLINPYTVDWGIILKLFPTMIALTLFSLMHVPINIPSLSISTRTSVDMNKELMAHGYSNILAGMLGGLQNYLCYSNSLLYFKTGGGGQASGYLLTAFTGLFFLLGPSIVYYVPRVMPGCLLIHIGIDLTLEALGSDSLASFDAIEYGSIVSITLIMTVFGMTEGLSVGVICAAMTFTIQASRHSNPVRGWMSARTLRSSLRRSVEEKDILDQEMKQVLVMQLQGYIFFANATILATEIEDKLIDEELLSSKVLYLILDFTLVNGIDSSAAETIYKIFDVCHNKGIRLAYSTGSPSGFPCDFPLSERLESHPAAQGRTRIKSQRTQNQCANCGMKGTMPTDSQGVTVCALCDASREIVVNEFMVVAECLDSALGWCETSLLCDRGAHLEPEQAHRVPLYLQTMCNLCKETGTDDPRDLVLALASYFQERKVEKGTVLWRQGEVSDSAVLSKTGRLRNELEDEAGTTEEVSPGHLVGEFGLISNVRRQGTLVAQEEACVLLVLALPQYKRMQEEKPHLAFLLAKICIAQLGHRNMKVSNRIWETHCLPV